MFGTYKYTFECLVKNDDVDDDAFLDFFFEELVGEIGDFLTIVFFFFLVVVVATKSSSESDENLAGALICLLEEDGGLRSFVVDI